jgi:hypothetical protein
MALEIFIPFKFFKGHLQKRNNQFKAMLLGLS